MKTLKVLFMLMAIMASAIFSVSLQVMGIVKPASGDFSASVKGAVLEKMDKMWADNMVNPEFIASCDAAKAILKEQTAKVTELEDPFEDKEIKIAWLKPQTTTPVDVADDCNIGGDELESTSKAYSLGYNKTTGFNVKEKADRTNLIKMDEKIALGFLMRMKDMDELVARTLISKIETFKGVNQFAGKGTVVSTDTYINPELWDSNLFANLKLIATKNKMMDPFLLSGTNLWEQYLNIELAQANADGKGDAAKIKIIRKYFDLINIDEVNDPNYVTYMINKGSIAGAFKAYHKNNPKEYTHGADQQRFAIESKNLPGVFYDVHYSNACLENDIVHKWSFFSKFDWFLNPVHDTNKTGVLSFINGEAPA